MEAIEERLGAVLLRIRVQPKASREAVLLEADGRIRVAITAPPVEGAANKAVCAFLAKRLGLPKRSVSLESGEKSREKTLLISGMAAAEVRARLLSGPEDRTGR